MPAVLVDERIVSAYDELMAYEYLYAREGSSRSHISKILSKYGGRPTNAVASIDGLLPDRSMHEEIRQYIAGHIGKFSILVDGTPQFPARLKAEKSPLPIFYYRGDISLFDSRCISVVGTRHPSDHGSKTAQRIAQALVEKRFTVVVGLAKGIDTNVAREVLDHKGNVIGVIGTPIDQYYPKENHDLQEQVATEHLLISQVPIYRYNHQPFKTKRYYFPERNITMSAIAEATVIVEAGETSGTRIQAKACMEQNKKLILLPQVVEKTTWAQRFVDMGATVASSVTDVLHAIG